MEWILCPVCGHRFNPEENAACSACPLNKACTLTCCPECGFETVNPENSKLVSLYKKLITLKFPSIDSSKEGS